MSPARSEPADLRGYIHRRWLGGGGFADVFLYHEKFPSRDVAVKVLRTNANDPARAERFRAEADLMAKVSSHHYIVTIHTAGIASDGRPYLVMEYYPNGHYGEITRPGGLGVAEALRVGVQVASAVETAHRAGILHGDIKPANVLISSSRSPGLTDFGGGLSLAYAAPEVIDGGGDSKSSDVYSLAITIYFLLAGRTPFDLPGHNTEKELIGRVLNTAPPPTGRSDLPASLEHLLYQALSKEPSARPQSAESIGNAMRDIEQELGLRPTQFELIVEDPLIFDRRPDDEDRTRAAPVRTVGLTFAPSRATGATSGPTARDYSGDRGATSDVFGPAHRQSTQPIDSRDPGPDRAGEEGRDSDADTTRHRAPTAPSGLPTAAAKKWDRGRRLKAGALAAAIVVAAGIGIAIATRSAPSGASPGNGSLPAAVTTAPPLVPPPPAPSNVVVTVNGAVAHVAWQAPGALAGDVYRVVQVSPSQSNGYLQVAGRSATVRGVKRGSTVCFEVATVRAGQILWAFGTGVRRLMTGTADVLGSLRIEYCDIWTTVHPNKVFVLGREGDLIIDDNAYLHRRFLELNYRDSMWWLTNVGNRMTATLSDPATSAYAWVPPAARLPLVFSVSQVRFSAGSTSYELSLHVSNAPFAPGISTGEAIGGHTTRGPVLLNAEQRLLVLALAEPSLRARGSGGTPLPSSAAAAKRLGWQVTKFNRKLDHLCEKLERSGIPGLHGEADRLASGRRGQLVQYALAMHLVGLGDLHLLDAPQDPVLSGQIEVAL